jgi:Zn finger protein HypA/HybF involved in hydrogenase expression
MRAKCECGEIVEIRRNPYVLDVFEGYCPKCGCIVKRKIYKCKSCNDYTPHKYTETTEKWVEIWICDRCGAERHIYKGLRKALERRMMAVGY